MSLGLRIDLLIVARASFGFGIICTICFYKFRVGFGVWMNLIEQRGQQHGEYSSPTHYLHQKKTSPELKYHQQKTTTPADIKTASRAKGRAKESRKESGRAGQIGLPRAPYCGGRGRWRALWCSSGGRGDGRPATAPPSPNVIFLSTASPLLSAFVVGGFRS